MQKRSNKKQVKPTLYLDTCIIQNSLRRRNTDDVVFFKRLESLGFKCITSIYTLLELFETAKDRTFLLNEVIKKWIEVNTFLINRRNKNLSVTDLTEISDDINNFFSENHFLEIYNINDDEDWNLVKEMCENTNIHYSDIIHLATAYNSKCTHLITRDKFFIKEGNKTLINNGVPPEEFIIITPDKFAELFFK